MPRSGGVMTPTAMIPVQSGSVADSSDFNDFADDVCDEITNSIPRDGTAGPTANTPWDNHRLTNLADATAATDAMNRQTADARYLPGGSLATDRLLGRDTAGTGAPEALTVSNGLAFTGSGGIGLANMNEATVKGRAVGSGAGVPADLTAAQLAAIIANAGTFTGTITGGTGGTSTVTVNYCVNGGVVTLWIDTSVAWSVSTTNTLTMTGLPAGIRPTVNRIVRCAGITDLNAALGGCTVQTGGTLVFFLETASGSLVTLSTTAFDASSWPKGLSAGWTISYPL